MSFRRVYIEILLLLIPIPTNHQKRYKRIQTKLTTLHNNKKTIELLQECVDYNTILASQMLLIYQNNTLTRLLWYFYHIYMRTKHAYIYAYKTRIYMRTKHARYAYKTRIYMGVLYAYTRV